MAKRGSSKLQSGGKGMPKGGHKNTAAHEYRSNTNSGGGKKGKMIKG